MDSNAIYAETKRESAGNSQESRIVHLGLWILFSGRDWHCLKVRVLTTDKKLFNEKHPPFRFARVKRPAVLTPLIPMTFVLAYVGDLGYGSKIHRIHGNENLLCK